MRTKGGLEENASSLPSNSVRGHGRAFNSLADYFQSRPATFAITDASGAFAENLFAEPIAMDIVTVEA